MPKNEQRFVRRHFLDGGVPYNYAFRCAEPGHVGVYLIGFGAGVHQKHPLAWDVQAGTMDHLLHGAGKRRILVLQRLKFVKKRVDYQRLKEDYDNDDRKRRDPEIDPPPPRTPAHHAVQNEYEHGRESCAERLSFEPIQQPGSPALNRLLVSQRKHMSINSGRQIKNIECENQQWNENQTLQPSIAAGSLRDITQPRADSKPQKQDQRSDADSIRQKPQDVLCARIRDGFLIAVLREGVLFRARRVWRLLRFFCRAGNGRLRRSLLG